ncbi:glycoside hydrolase N-terminal domain-containing protein [Acidaminobacter sp. JC074]|uniref:glycoside hydrolase family 95 protein n=1 Tax=Acidaminobacter sp. JC074 TaxID=2530199 RepID=UPI001F10D308|nr:glycoside hydrolase family 95 protein [Acidaminobacter sp. JC074]
MRKKIYFEEGAPRWEEACPLGNGRLGAMVYGRVKHEVIQFNEDTLWSGKPNMRESFDTSQALLEARRLIDENHLRQAQLFMNKNMLGEYSESYLPMSLMTLSFNHPSSYEDYERVLDLDKGVLDMTYTSDKTTYKRKYYCSKVDDVFIIDLSASRRDRLSFIVELDSLLRHEIKENYESLLILGEVPIQVYPAHHETDSPVEYGDGMKFSFGIKVLTDGVVSTNNQRLFVQSATQAKIVLTGYTSFIDAFTKPASIAPVEKTLETIDRCMKADSLSVHIKDFTELSRKSDLSFGEADRTPIKERIESHTSLDPVLLETLFHYGKYLAISASRKGTQATNLQGIWNSMIQPPWSSNYTLNINTEMNYWPLDAVGLETCFEPFVSLVKDLSITGKVAAKALACSGWTVHHNSDLWKKAIPAAKSASYGFWPMGGPWMTSLLVDHYRYNQNQNFLEEIYDVLIGSVNFCLDWLYDDGGWTTSPSTSPENSFLHKGESCAVSKSSTMDMVIIWQLFNDFLEIEHILNRNISLKERVADVLSNLPDYPIKDDLIMEWSRDFKEKDPGHRHLSHLCGLYPGHRVNVHHSTVEAHMNSLKTRIKHGGCQTSWSCAWGIALAARGHDKVLVEELLNQFTRKSLINNGLSSHPPFQIDGNFGLLAGMVEMIVQKIDDEIHVLPALPESIKEGYVKGIRLRENLEIDIRWKKGMVEYLELKGVKKPYKLYVNHTVILVENDERFILEADDLRKSTKR